jgi:hypothetical protein
MKSLNSAYKSQRGTDKSSVYLFILDKGQVGDSNPAGELPRGKQFGYLFTGNGGDIDWTIAHELGHGLFRLQHTFDGEYGGTAKSLKAQTDNLMDYGGGTHLAKWQWDEIHDPALLVNPFEGDEDAMFIGCNAPQPKTKGKLEGEKTTTSGILSGVDPMIMTQCTKTWYYHADGAAGWYETEKYAEIVQPVIKGLLITQTDDVILELREDELYDVYSLKLNYLVAFQAFYANENLDEDSFGTLLTDEIVSKACQGLRKDINDIHDRRSGRLESVSPEFELLSFGLGAVIKNISVKIASKVAIKGLSARAFYTTVRSTLGKGNSLLKPLGLGSTGRTVANNLTEELAMKEAMANPSIGKMIMEGITDMRWPGWSKMQYIHTSLDGNKTVIHYVGKFENGILRYVDDFKFK